MNGVNRRVGGQHNAASMPHADNLQQLAQRGAKSNKGDEGSIEDHNVSPPLPGPIPPIHALANDGKMAVNKGVGRIEDHNVTPPQPAPFPPIIPAETMRAVATGPNPARIEDHNVTPIIPGPIPPIEPEGISMKAVEALKHDAFVSRDTAVISRQAFSQFSGAQTQLPPDPIDEPRPPK